jgi:isocitrate dehydrogenase
MADTPELFDVVVMPNLYGDVLSDIAAQLTGSVGLAGSANIGEECAMFEAIHGSAPLIAGQNVANPSGLIQAAIMMLNHIGQNKVAEKVHNAWLKTLEDGIHTADIFKEGVSKQKVGTQEFAQAVVLNLGKKPSVLKSVQHLNNYTLNLPKYRRRAKAKKVLDGVDLFVHWNGTDANELAARLQRLEINGIQLNVITNRGIKVWPDGFKETFCTDHWRCRFRPQQSLEISKIDIATLLTRAIEEDIDVIKTENLYSFDGKVAYSLAQGQ